MAAFRLGKSGDENPLLLCLLCPEPEAPASNPTLKPEEAPGRGVALA